MLCQTWFHPSDKKTMRLSGRLAQRRVPPSGVRRRAAQTPYPEGHYDPDTAAAYFQARELGEVCSPTSRANNGKQKKTSWFQTNLTEWFNFTFGTKKWYEHDLNNFWELKMVKQCHQTSNKTSNGTNFYAMEQLAATGQVPGAWPGAPVNWCPPPWASRSRPWVWPKMESKIDLMTIYKNIQKIYKSM